MRYIIIAICFTFLIYGNVQSVYAEDAMQKLNAHGIESIVNKLTEQNLFTESAKINLLNKYKYLPTNIKQSLSELSGDQIEKRLLQYVNDKRVFTGKTAQPLDNVGDFYWQYLMYDVKWAMVSVVSADAATIHNIASGPTVIFSEGLDIPLEAAKEKTIIVPTLNDTFSIYASGVTGDTVWHAENVRHPVTFPLSYSEGVVLFINSTPEEADIYFDKNKYHKQTNTTCVRDPGECLITIKKDKYENWNKKYNLKKGERYIINAPLKPLTQKD